MATTTTYNGTNFELDDDGHLLNSKEWSIDLAKHFASLESITLSEKHFKVLEFLRKEFAEKGTLPTMRKLSSSTFSIKEMYELFPGGPLKLSSKIAGLPKPKSCV